MANTGTGLTLRDRTLLQMAYKGASAAEIGAELQVAPERVALELDRITKSVDWLNDLQRYKLAMSGLQSLIGALRDKAESGADPQLVKSYIDALRLTFEQIEKQAERVDSQIERVEGAQARKLMEIVDRSFYLTLGKLEARLEGSGLPKAEIEAVFRESLLTIAREYDEADE